MLNLYAHYSPKPSSPTETPDPSVYGLSSTRTSPKPSQHSVAQYTNSLRPERSVTVQGSTISTAQLDRLRHSPKTISQHGPVVIRDIRDPTPQSQSGTTAHYQVTDERPSKRLRLESEQISVIWNFQDKARTILSRA